MFINKHNRGFCLINRTHAKTTEHIIVGFLHNLSVELQGEFLLKSITASYLPSPLFFLVGTVAVHRTCLTGLRSSSFFFSGKRGGVPLGTVIILSF